MDCQQPIDSRRNPHGLIQEHCSFCLSSIVLAGRAFVRLPLAVNQTSKVLSKFALNFSLLTNMGLYN